MIFINSTRDLFFNFIWILVSLLIDEVNLVGVERMRVKHIKLANDGEICLICMIMVFLKLLLFKCCDIDGVIDNRAHCIVLAIDLKEFR